MLSLLRPVCSEAIIDFLAQYSTTGPAAGFSIYFSGYSFIPSGYTDNGSTVTVSDGIGGVFTTGIDIVARSTPGADPLFVGISGTPLSSSSALYTVTLNSKTVNDVYSCTKTVIHNTATAGDTGIEQIIGRFVDNLSGSTSTLTLVTGLPFIPSILLPQAGNTYTATLLSSNPYFVSYTSNSAILNFTSPVSINSSVVINWIVYPQTG